MKKIFFLALILASVVTFGQTDTNGNPVFNSVITNEEVIDGLTVISNYYTLKNNLENKGSTVYISDRPTLAEVSASAINLPSEFFLVAKDHAAVSLIMVRQYPKAQVVFVNPSNGDTKEFGLKAKGDITQNRAEEIIAQKYDPKAVITGNTLTFNGKKYAIISNIDIKKQVLELIFSEKLSQAAPSGMMVRTQAETKQYVIEQSAQGGEFDFFTAITGKEMDGVQIKPGIFTTKQSVALYQWGRACYETGVNTQEDALALFAEIIARKLNQREEDYIKMGFNKEWEK